MPTIFIPHRSTFPVLPSQHTSYPILSGEVRLTRDEEDADEDIFALDPSPSQPIPSNKTKARIPAEVAELAEKLDTLLTMLVGFLDAQLALKDLQVTRRLHTALLDVFEKRLLVAHRSKFVQFVVFWFASRQLSFGYDLSGRLLAKALGKEAPIIRQSAVMYLASFVSRANFLPIGLIR